MWKISIQVKPGAVMLPPSEPILGNRMPISSKNVCFSEKSQVSLGTAFSMKFLLLRAKLCMWSFSTVHVPERVSAQAPPPQAGINIVLGVVPPIVPAVVAGLFHFLVLLSGMIEKVTASLVT